MSKNRLACDPERIELFLGQKLSDDEQTAFESHLDDCDDCRRRLDAAAAPEDAWSGVRESLLGEPADGMPHPDDGGPDSAAGDNAQFSHDTVLRLLAPTDDERMLGRLGAYEVVGVVGWGGMGVVLKGFDAALNRYVAIKVLAPHLGSSGAARQRFAREAQAAAAVVHENVIEIHGVADADGLPYLVMPYLRGPSLQRRLDDHGPLGLVEILRIGLQAAGGLAAAHAQGIVHRDVKPANILLADGVERVKLTDFGLARAADDASLTRTGVIAGTPQYMSPEQARGDSVDQRSDLFSLGSVLYAMCTGRAPFRAETSYGVLRRITDDEPRPIREINPDIPDWLCRIIARLMAKRPGDRFQSAREVAELLKACLAHVQQPTAVPLPQRVAALGESSAPPALQTAARGGRGPVFKRLAAAALGLAAIFAGVLIVLELNKGTLAIECEADDVPVRIMQGDRVVDTLTVTRSGASVRIAAGQYVVELDGAPDGIRIENGTVTLERGGRAIVKITRRKGQPPAVASAGREATVRNLTRLMAALHDYQEVHGRFPPAVVLGKDGKGKVPHSWRVELLPYLGEQALYRQYRFDEPWDSAHNKALLARMPDVYRSPRDKADSTSASYFGIVATDLRPRPAGGDEAGEGAAAAPGGVIYKGIQAAIGMTFFWQTGGCRVADITDGTLYTVALVEAKRDIPWTKPEDIDYAADKPLPEFGGWYPGGWHAGLAVGQVRFFASDNDEATVRHLLTINDGIPVHPKLAAGSGNTAPAAEAGPAATQAPPPAAGATPKVTSAAPKRLRQFTGLTTGHAVIVAVSPDGKRIAVANGNPTMILLGAGRSRVKDNWKPTTQILDVETGEVVVSLQLSTAAEDEVLAATQRISHFEVRALAFSPDGKLLAVGTSIGQAKLFDAQSGKLVRSLDDEAAKLADKETPENWKPLRRAQGSVASLAFSPDGSLLATCGGSFADFAERFDAVERLGFRATGPGRLKLWDVRTGALKHDLVGHNDQAYAVAFSPDGRWLASAGRWLEGRDFGNGVILWNPRTGKAIHSLIRSTASGGVRSIAFSPDGNLLVLGTQRFDDDSSTGGVSLVHTSSGIPQWLTTVPGWAKPVAFLPDGASVAVLCGGRSIRFLEAKAGTLLHEIRPADSPQNVRWEDFAISPQGRTLVVGGVDDQRRGSVEVWHLPGNGRAAPPASPAPSKAAGDARSEPIKNFTTAASVGSVALSPDGKLVAAASAGPASNGQGDNGKKKPTVEILDAATGKLVVSLGLISDAEDAVLDATQRVSHFEVNTLAFSPDGNVLAVGTSIGQLKLFDARSGELLRSLDDVAAKRADKATPESWKSLSRALGSVRSLAFSPDGSLLATCGESIADFARIFGDQPDAGGPVTASGRLKVWDVKTGALQRDLAGYRRAAAVAFSPDGRLLACAGSWLSNNRDEAGVILWDPRTGAQVRRIATMDGQPRAIAFSSDGKRLAIGSQRPGGGKDGESGKGGLRLVRVGSGMVEWARSVGGLPKPVFFPHEHSIVVLCDRNAMWFLGEETGETMMVLRAPSADSGSRWNDLVVAANGHALAIGGVDGAGRGTLQVWDFTGP